MIGQKGVPARGGGVERHVEELGARLADLGHEVVVFTRPNYTDPALTSHRGIRLRSLPTVNSKHLDATVHSFLAACASWGGDFDIVHFHAVGPALMSPISRIRGRGVVCTVHGQDQRREKWGRFATVALSLGEACALNVPHATISVSSSLTQRYHDSGHPRVVYIPNGVSIIEGEDPDYLRGLGLEPGRYVLFAARLVPEKAVHTLIDAHAKLDCDIPLVIAGGSSHSDEYASSLRERADPDRVRFLGHVEGLPLATLFRNASVFVLPSTLEGQPIVLLEALAYGTPVIASDIPANLELLDDEALVFPVGDADALAEVLRHALSRESEPYLPAAGSRAGAAGEHDWDMVARQTVALYEAVAGRRDVAAREDIAG